METIIEFRNTNFAYNNTNAFNDFNMEISSGDIVTLIGTSGSGKTTLLKMLCNKLPNGSVYYNGRNIKTYDAKDLQRQIVVIFDAPIMCASMEDEIKRYVRRLHLENEEIEERMEELEKYFDLQTLKDVDTARMSKEDQTLIKILRFLIIKPKFLAIDSILSMISAKNKKKFFDYIKNNKITLLNVTANLDEALYGNKLYVLENFVLILEGSTLSVLKTDTLLKRLGFKLPVPVDLSIELNHYDVLNKIYTSNEKLVNALWK